MNSQKRILIVEDEVAFCRLLDKRLTRKGSLVDAFGSAEEAQATLDKKSYDVALVDIKLPGIDGIETLKLLKEKNPDLEIIMLTGHATVQKGIEAMKLGAEDFLEKPVELSVLLERISEAKNKRILILEKKSQDAIKKIITTKAW